MTPERVLSALAAHAQTLDVGRPDPLVMEAAEKQLAGIKPGKFKVVRDEETGEIDVAQSWLALRTAQGKGTRGIGKTQLHEAAADALAGMPKRHWQALQVAIGIDLAAREAVIRRLLREAWKSRKRDNFWPASVDRQFCSCGRAPSADYVRDLVELAVKQLEHPQDFATHWQRARWFGFSERHWRRIMVQPFDVVSGQAWAWYHAGIGYIHRRLKRRREFA